MKQRRQRDFFENNREFRPNRLTHGGKESLRKRKITRPLDTKRPVHITMKSLKAKGRLSMIRKKIEIAHLVETTARKNSIKIHRFANVGNHLHILMSFKSRKQAQTFLRITAGLVARLVTGAKKGNAFGKFWDELAHSRVITGLRGFVFANEYVKANEIEALLGRNARETFLELHRSRRRGLT